MAVTPRHNQSEKPPTPPLPCKHQPDTTPALQNQVMVVVVGILSGVHGPFIASKGMAMISNWDNEVRLIQNVSANSFPPLIGHLHFAKTSGATLNGTTLNLSKKTNQANLHNGHFPLFEGFHAGANPILTCFQFSSDGGQRPSRPQERLCFQGQVKLHSSAVFLIYSTTSCNNPGNQEGFHLVVEEGTRISQSDNRLIVVRGLIPPKPLCLSLTLHVFLREVMDAHEKVRFFNLSLGNVTLTFSKKETLLKRPKCSGLSFVQGSWHDKKWTPFCAPENIDPAGTPAPFSGVLNVFADSVYRMMNFPLCNLLNLTQRRSINFVPHAGIDSCCSDTGCIVRETYYLPTPLTNKLFPLTKHNSSICGPPDGVMVDPGHHYPFADALVFNQTVRNLILKPLKMLPPFVKIYFLLTTGERGSSCPEKYGTQIPFRSLHRILVRNKIIIEFCRELVLSGRFCKVVDVFTPSLMAYHFKEGFYDGDCVHFRRGIAANVIVDGLLPFFQPPFFNTPFYGGCGTEDDSSKVWIRSAQKSSDLKG